MEETNSKSTVAAEGTDTDQKLPATPTSSPKGSAREKVERDAERKAGRSESRSPVPGALALSDTDQKLQPSFITLHLQWDLPIFSLDFSTAFV
jgi:hypothetical protein